MMKLAAATAAALALAATDAAAINKCVDNQGKVTYQEAQCPVDVKAETIRTPSGGGSAAEPEPAPSDSDVVNPAEDDKDDPKMMILVTTLANYEVCSMEPTFNEAHGNTFNNWRTRNQKQLARLNRSVKYQAILESARNQVRSQAVASPDKFTKFCEGQFAPAVDKNYAK